ncbi:hypothetical protein OFR22_13090 [Brachyspira hyodysenteriae]|uniref:hypothetical protein n=2 Tax=Brachyspira hyodysenteriae TaxID=159 RepID=UPI0022CD23B1|nr:hypothetical protein [Brachyspira hyodysenteriae]MCZ9840577.1 hypothetical protein [Brachyspira hyodysenteriae]MCZ9849665.1 hypothetical protein [Brachyspira hyodysenteriae]MCZ9851544.1 hypothetical protein [Brachyspira hyodysenteriae]MCZ9859716.1 hypothetical protein [Brachyspira hyodysenteriae]MCZ9870320.1 hypothetical protein [Brachyspira hyodysenteriae]
MTFLEELHQHYINTKIVILTVISNQIAEQYPALKDSMEIRRNKLEINNDLCNCYIDLEDGAFKICIDGQTPYCYEDFESVLTDIEDEIASNE